MGTTYLIVNTAKRQYFDPGWMGNSKYSGLLYGIGGHALARLLFPNPHGWLIESWRGDPLYAIGDEPEELFPDLAYQAADGRSAGEVVIEEYDDITLNLIDSMLGGDTLDWYFTRADESDFYFLILANIVLYVSPGFAKAFEQRYGKNWQLRYRKAVKACAPWFPMPMTEENRKNIDGRPRAP